MNLTTYINATSGLSQPRQPAAISKEVTLPSYLTRPSSPCRNAAMSATHVPSHSRPKLDVILAQDHQYLDTLLVDDGSIGGCVAMCDSCASRTLGRPAALRPALLHNQSHFAVSHETRN